jgi:hypothetical protein
MAWRGSDPRREHPTSVERRQQARPRRLALAAAAAISLAALVRGARARRATRNTRRMDGAFVDLPGADLVSRGLRDLAAGRASVEALLVSRASIRLRACGVAVDEPLPDADRELYRLLAARDGNGAHSTYNALTRRLVSFMRAAERHAP